MKGCLMDWCEVVEAHLEKAKGAITGVHILNLYHSFMKYMGEPVSCLDSELERIANFKPPRDIKNKLKQLPIGSLYQDLFYACTTI